ncbi:hypothetical protein [Mesonia sp. HuA40]|uniref:hypothetical protein n=1 Tax=Mesonia sp. HuA40 TaxID=2602761 RepID=UPI0011C82C23|nr:hypothetical protein [Mesonia sp. HuA40]TXK72692.1 hypothetical protein FT993_07635 [Mesonia sp. HuA40]
MKKLFLYWLFLLSVFQQVGIAATSSSSNVLPRDTPEKEHYFSQEYQNSFQGLPTDEVRTPLGGENEPLFGFNLLDAITDLESNQVLTFHPLKSSIFSSLDKRLLFGVFLFPFHSFL